MLNLWALRSTLNKSCFNVRVTPNPLVVTFEAFQVPVLVVIILPIDF